MNSTEEKLHLQDQINALVMRMKFDTLSAAEIGTRLHKAINLLQMIETTELIGEDTMLGQALSDLLFDNAAFEFRKEHEDYDLL